MKIEFAVKKTEQKTPRRDLGTLIKAATPLPIK